MGRVSMNVRRRRGPNVSLESLLLALAASVVAALRVDDEDLAGTSALVVEIGAAAPPKGDAGSKGKSNPDASLDGDSVEAELAESLSDDSASQDVAADASTGSQLAAGGALGVATKATGADQKEKEKKDKTEEKEEKKQE